MGSVLLSNGSDDAVGVDVGWAVVVSGPQQSNIVSQQIDKYRRQSIRGKRNSCISAMHLLNPSASSRIGQIKVIYCALP